MRTFDVFSKRERGGLPILNNASLMLGNGATVVIENGQSVEPVDEATARLLRDRDDVTLIPHGDSDPFAANDQAEGRSESDAERIARLERELTEAKAAAAPKAKAKPKPKPAAAADDDDEDGDDLTPEQRAAIEAAKEHLRDDGEDVPAEDEPAGIEMPAGFSAFTDEQRPRCLAAKGDGGQCTNEAKDGHACGLAKHKEQLAGAAA